MTTVATAYARLETLDPYAVFADDGKREIDIEMLFGDLVGVMQFEGMSREELIHKCALAWDSTTIELIKKDDK